MVYGTPADRIREKGVALAFAGKKGGYRSEDEW
jgi:hypothetical protein